MPRKRMRRKPSEPQRPRRRWPPWAAVGVLLGGTAVVQFHLIVHELPNKTFYSGDCGIKLLQVQSLVARHWRSLALIYPGEVIDHDHHFVETGGLIARKGQVFGSHSAAFAIAASFPYAWWGYGGLYVVPALSLLAAGFLLWLVARSWNGPWRALLVCALLVSATPLLFYGLEFWEHALAAFLIMGALICVVARQTPASWLRLGAGGAVLAIAFAVRPESAAFFAALLLGLAATVRPWSELTRVLAWLIAGYALVLAPMVVLNTWVFGDPWGTLLGLHLRAGHADPRSLVVTKLLSPLDRALLAKSLLAAVAALAVWRLRERERRRARGGGNAFLSLLAITAVLILAALEANRAWSLWRHPRELTSLVETLPFLWSLPVVIATWAEAAEVQARARRRFLVVTTLSFLGAVLAITPTWGGAQWGPRQLLLLMPMLALLAAGFGPISSASGRVALSAVLLLAAISLGVQAGGVKFLAEVKGKYVNMVDNYSLLTEPGAVIASDQFFLQEVLAPIYYQRCFFYLASPQLSGEFLTALRQAKVRQFYFFFKRGPRPSKADVEQQLRACDMLRPGVVPLQAWIIKELPYYFVRLGLTTTQRYTHLEVEDLQAQVADMPANPRCRASG